MLAACWKLLEIVFHGSYMCMTPQDVSGKRYMHGFLGIETVNFTCWLHVENVSDLVMYLCRPQWYSPSYFISATVAVSSRH